MGILHDPIHAICFSCTRKVAIHNSQFAPASLMLTAPTCSLCLQVVVTQIPEPEPAGAGAGDMMGGY